MNVVPVEIAPEIGMFERYPHELTNCPLSDCRELWHTPVASAWHSKNPGRENDVPKAKRVGGHGRGPNALHIENSHITRVWRQFREGGLPHLPVKLLTESVIKRKVFLGVRFLELSNEVE